MAEEAAGVRVDRWLWSVRIFKTRGAAAEACRGGHVKVGGRTVKPSRQLAVGDRVGVRDHDRLRDLEVLRLIDKRVGAAIASACYLDHAPAPVRPEPTSGALRRERGSGRPTKRERRQIDRLRGRRA